MRFCLTSFKDFKNILLTAELVLTEIKFEADNEGLRFRGFDGGKTSFFSVDFKKDYFDEYEIDEPESIIIDSSEITKIMKRIKNDDIVCATIDDYNLTIKVNDKKTFKINAIDMDYDTQGLPEMNHKVKTMVDFHDFKDSVADSKLYSNTFVIESKDGNLLVSANGTLGEYNSELLVGDEIDDGHRSVFNNELISSLFKIGDLSDMINVNIGTNYPMLLRVKDDLEEVMVELLIAPRIEQY